MFVTAQIGQSSFSQTHKNFKIFIIANVVLKYICSFLHCLDHIMLDLVNVKLDVSGYKRFIFRVCRLHWSCSFLMAQLK